jgi:hypothetical protein
MLWQQASTENFEIAIPPRTYYRISQNIPAPILAKKPAPFFRNHREKIYPSIQVISPTALHHNSLHFHQTGKDGQRVAYPTRLSRCEQDKDKKYLSMPPIMLIFPCPGHPSLSPF